MFHSRPFPVLAVAAAAVLATASSAVAATYDTVGGHLEYPHPVGAKAVTFIGSNGYDSCGFNATSPPNYIALAAGYNMDFSVLPAPVSVVAGEYLNLTYVAYGPWGFGPLRVRAVGRFDASGLASGLELPIVNNMPGNTGYMAAPPAGAKFPYAYNIVAYVPPGVNCPMKGMCLLQVTNGQGFGSCARMVVGKEATSPVTTITPGYRPDWKSAIMSTTVTNSTGTGTTGTNSTSTGTTGTNSTSTGTTGTGSGPATIPSNLLEEIKRRTILLLRILRVMGLATPKILNNPKVFFDVLKILMSI